MADQNQQPGRAHTWPLYQGTKQLKATPMRKGSYCILRGWTVPADEDPYEEGYCVEYQDGGKPNVEGFAGYVSWSPAGVFEQAYKPCATHVERMRIEFDELEERLGKLITFMGTEIYDDLPLVDRLLLQHQVDAMHVYRRVLLCRLELSDNG